MASLQSCPRNFWSSSAATNPCQLTSDVPAATGSTLCIHVPDHMSTIPACHARLVKQRPLQSEVEPTRAAGYDARIPAGPFELGLAPDLKRALSVDLIPTSLVSNWRLVPLDPLLKWPHPTRDISQPFLFDFFAVLPCRRSFSPSSPCPRPTNLCYRSFHLPEAPTRLSRSAGQTFLF